MNEKALKSLRHRLSSFGLADEDFPLCAKWVGSLDLFGGFYVVCLKIDDGVTLLGEHEGVSLGPSWHFRLMPDVQGRWRLEGKEGRALPEEVVGTADAWKHFKNEVRRMGCRPEIERKEDAKVSWHARPRC